MNQHADVSVDYRRRERPANATSMHQILLALVAIAGVTITAAGQSVTTIPEGMPVRVRLLQFISETSQPGEAVRFEVSEDVVVKNLVVISRHTPVVGSITSAKAYRSSLNCPSLALTLVNLCAHRR
jgi:hypothetical protein